MNRILYCLILCSIMSLTACQSEQPQAAKSQATSETTPTDRPNSTQPRTGVPDTSPLYPGCDQSDYESRKKCSQGKLSKALQQSLKYPQVAVDNNVNGYVVCDFVVRKDGTMSGLEVRQSLTPETDAAAYHAIVDMMEASGPWEPATLGGRKVDARFTLPIKFGRN